MKKTALAIGAAATICLAGTAAPAALAQTHTPHASGFKAKVSPSKPKVGQTVKATATGADKSSDYYCLLSLYHKGITGNAGTADTASLITVKSSSSGKLSCNQVFLKFSGTWKGKKHNCPPTKADKKAGWGCAVSFAEVSNHNNVAQAPFKF